MKSIKEKAKAYDEAIKRLEDIKTGKCQKTFVFTEGLFDYIFPELKESEDGNIRKEIISALKFANVKGVYDKHIAWLEKQGEHANFRNKIQIGDKVTRNEDGVLVNLSQLNRVAKKDEKQDEQNPANKVEPKFKVGDWVVYTGYLLKDSGKEIYVMQVASVEDDRYNFTDTSTLCFDSEKDMRSWTIQDAKDGDVLANDTTVLIVNHLGTFENRPIIYSWYFSDSSKFYGMGPSKPDRWEVEGFTPATKKQRDLLFQKMKEAGYEWDADKKELKKIEQKPADLPNGKDYGIDGLYAAIDILQKTLGKVEGYQTDDGILEHECAISAVKKLSKHKPAWSEEDKCMLNNVIDTLKPLSQTTHSGYAINSMIAWLKSIKDKVQPQPKQEWSEEDEYNIAFIVELLYGIEDSDKEYENKCRKMAKWLKSLRPQNKWKPSEEQMDALEDAIADAVSSIQKNMLNSLYQDLQKLR